MFGRLLSLHIPFRKNLSEIKKYNSDRSGYFSQGKQHALLYLFSNELPRPKGTGYRRSLTLKKT